MVDSHFPPGWDAVIVHCCCFDDCNEVKVFLLLISPQGLQTGFGAWASVRRYSSIEVGQLAQGQAIAIWRSQDPSPGSHCLTQGTISEPHCSRT